MSKKLPRFNIERKLKSNEKLVCSGCNFVFESIFSAAEHTIDCQVIGMEKKKRKKELESQMKFKYQRTETTASPQNKLYTVTLHWSRRNTAILLKNLYKRAHLFSKENKGSVIWQEIEKEVKPQVPWMYASICLTRWKKLRLETENYMTSQNKGDSKVLKPQFYYIIREIIREMTTTQEEVVCKKEEGEPDTTQEELADPDAVEDEPFAGVMDSQGNMHLREVLLEIVHTIETKPNITEDQLVSKHGVEEAIVEWVKENQEAVTKGSLQCSSCNKRLLKRKDYVLHELDCIIQTDQPKPDKDNKGLVFSYSKRNQGIWSSSKVETLLKVFKARVPAFLTHDGTLRRGIWLEICKELMPQAQGVTPQMCSDKWAELLTEARTYRTSKKNGQNEARPPPPFYEQISSFLDLDNHRGISLKSQPQEDEGGGAESPRVFLKSPSDEELDENKGEAQSENKEMEEEQDFLDDFDVNGTESMEETGSGGETSEDSKETFFPLRSKGREFPLNLVSKETDTKGKRLTTLERRVDFMTSHLKEMEEENRSLRHQRSANKRNDGVDAVINRLNRFLVNQNRLQAQQNEAMTKMCSMLERHHRENLAAMKALIHELVAKRREKKK